MNQWEIKSHFLKIVLIILSTSTGVTGQARLALDMELLHAKHQDLSVSSLINKGTGTMYGIRYVQEGSQSVFSSHIRYSQNHLTSSAGNHTAFTYGVMDFSYKKKVFTNERGWCGFAGAGLETQFMLQWFRLKNNAFGNTFPSVFLGSVISPEAEIRKIVNKGWLSLSCNLGLIGTAARPGYNYYLSDSETLAQFIQRSRLVFPEKYLSWNIRFNYHYQATPRTAFELGMQNTYQRIALPLPSQRLSLFTTGIILSYQFCFLKRN